MTATEVAERHEVSTHSRLKAAAPLLWFMSVRVSGFNTQPPEGGCFMT